MLQKNFYLLSDTSIICSYLVSQWIESFANMPGFQGILAKEEMPSDQVLQKRKNFHTKYAGQKQLTPQMHEELLDLYPDLDNTEKSMISKYGICKNSPTDHDTTIFLGNNLNGLYAKNWLNQVSQNCPPFIFVCASQILKSWWIEMTKSQIFNSHTAVLPYARGMYAIENIAILKDINMFKKAVGVTIHYVDQGVDTGSIIRSERVVDPFCFSSIWELKGYLYMKEFELYIKTAQEILTNNETKPSGIAPDPQLQGPNFRVKDFTLKKQRQAEEGYLYMKNSHSDISTT